MKEKG